MNLALLHSLRFRVVLGAALLLLILSFLLVTNTQHLLDQVADYNIRSNINQTSETLNLAISPYTTKEGLQTLSEYFQELISGGETGIVYLALQEEDQTILFQTSTTPSPLPMPSLDNEDRFQQEIIHLSQPILLQGNRVGILRYGMSWKQLHEAIKQVNRDLLVLLTLGIIILIGLLVLLAKGINQRLTRLMIFSRQLAGGDYKIRAEEKGDDEISQLVHDFNLMAQAVEDRIHDLEKSTSEIQKLNETLEHRVELRTLELEKALENLEQTQKNLVQSEKLAGLGSIVAAVSHELNTPIGNALTVATSFADKAKSFKRESEQGLRRSTLEKFVVDSFNAGELVERNLSRASELITSFKHVAIDQTSSKRRKFELDKVLHEIVSTLTPTFKKTQHILRTDFGSAIEMNSFPGPIGQVVTNFINNALLHAFDESDTGTMTLTCRALNDKKVEITFSDDGRGIPAADLENIFDPFFTTQLGKGGSGLGLHIVHNIITGLLGGELKVNSDLDKGTQFIINLPLVSPLSTDEKDVV